MKNRWDFFVYHHGGYFGIDIFSTTRKASIMTNIRHKLLKYADVPSTTPIFFIIDAPTISDDDVLHATKGSMALKKHPNITVCLLDTFLMTVLPTYQPLALPDGIRLAPSDDVEDIEQK